MYCLMDVAGVEGSETHELAEWAQMSSDDTCKVRTLCGTVDIASTIYFTARASWPRVGTRQTAHVAYQGTRSRLRRACLYKEWRTSYRQRVGGMRVAMAVLHSSKGFPHRQPSYVHLSSSKVRHHAQRVFNSTHAKLFSRRHQVR